MQEEQQVSSQPKRRLSVSNSDALSKKRKAEVTPDVSSSSSSESTEEDLTTMDGMKPFLRKDIYVMHRYTYSHDNFKIEYIPLGSKAAYKETAMRTPGVYTCVDFGRTLLVYYV